MFVRMLELASAFRSLCRSPRQTLLAITTLAAGLTCVVLMLAVINGLLLRPVPFPKPGELALAGTFGEWGSDYLDPMSREQARAIRERLAGLAEVAGFQRTDVTLSDTETQRDYGAYVTANLFRLLGVVPVLGRDFNAEDEKPGAPVVIAISERLWRTRYGSDPNIVGRVVRANAQPAIVAAVMPGDFSFPTKEAIWMPAPASRNVNYELVVRRAPGIGNPAIVAALQDWLEQSRKEDGGRYKGKSAGINDMRNMTFGALREPLYMMLASAGLLLLLACTSTANILLARVSTQYRDIVVRIALGATWRRILVHVVAESLLFGVAAAGLAVLLTDLAMAALIAWFRANDFGPALWQRFDVDWRVLAFTGGVLLATTLLTALPAALRAYRTTIGQGLRETASVSISRAPKLLRGLLVAQVMLSCASLISVAMMVRAIVMIDSADVGIVGAGLLTARVTVPAKRYASPDEQRAFLRNVRDRLAAQPGVLDVSIGSAVPGTFWSGSAGIAAKDAHDPGDDVPVARSGVVDHGFFDTYGVMLQEGRLFDDRDDGTHPRVAVVDKKFARRFSPDVSIIGREFRINPKAADAYSVTIVGVVNDLKLGSRMQPLQPTILFYAPQSALPLTQSVTVRLDPAATVSASQLDRSMQGVDRDVPIAFVRYEDQMLRHTNTIHVFARAFYVVGIVAFVLMASGLYGVVMVTVARRTREIGLKRSLGARTGQILATIFGEIGACALAGVALGLLIGIPSAQALDASLIKFGGSMDPLVLGCALGLLLIAAVGGAVMPALHALRVDPTRALKAD